MKNLLFKIVHSKWTTCIVSLLDILETVDLIFRLNVTQYICTYLKQKYMKKDLRQVFVEIAGRGLNAVNI